MLTHVTPLHQLFTSVTSPLYEVLGQLKMCFGYESLCTLFLYICVCQKGVYSVVLTGTVDSDSSDNIWVK